MNSDREISDLQRARALLAGVDTIYPSCDFSISAEMRERLTAEKQVAQMKATTERTVHCPEWLGARVCPQGARGGYAFLLETEDFSVKLLGEHIPNRPGIYLELRSLFLHTHPDGPAGAAKAALAWVREHLLADQDYKSVERLVSFEAAKLSRVDIHIDWQGGYAPTLSGAADELHRFIRPGKTKWAFYGQGLCPTGYTFGRGAVQARLYNKTLETKEKANDAYAALLAARNGDHYDPNQDVWRLEFQLRREGVKGFRLYSPPEVDDPDEEIDAELAAEELQHLGTLPRFFARMPKLFAYLSRYWLRLVETAGETEHTNRSRLPMDPTWVALRQQFAQLVTAVPPDEDAGELVRGARYSGKNRILRRLALGVVKSLEVVDASSTSAALLILQRWVERVVEGEVARITGKCALYAARNKPIPCWARQGMEERFRHTKQVEHRVQMLLGIFGAKGVLPLGFKPARSVADLLLQHLDELETEAAEKGGVQQVLAAHFAKIYKLDWQQRTALYPCRRLHNQQRHAARINLQVGVTAHSRVVRSKGQAASVVAGDGGALQCSLLAGSLRKGGTMLLTVPMPLQPVSSSTSLGDSGSTGSYAHRTSARAAAHRAGTRADTTSWVGCTDGWEEWLP